MLWCAFFTSNALYHCEDSVKKLEVKTEKEKVEIKTESKEAKCKTKMHLKLETKKNDGIEAKLEFYSKEDKVKSKFHVRQKVFRVIEFNDNNNNNIVDDDELVQSLSVGSDWEPFTSNVSNGVYTISASSDWFTIVARYSGSPVTLTVNSTRYSLDPSAMKMDYIIDGFPYKGNSTKLALDGRFKSKAKFHNKRRKDKYDDFEVRDEGAVQGAKFTWVKTVSADGEEVAVVASSLAEYAGDDEADKASDGEKNYKMLWVFNTTSTPARFEWDPSLQGIDKVLETAGVSSRCISPAVGLFGLLWLTLAL